MSTPEPGESPQGKTPRESASTLSESMMPDQLNHHGNVFGGEILALVDKCGGVVARRHARTMVTLAAEYDARRTP